MATLLSNRVKSLICHCGNVATCVTHDGQGYCTKHKKEAEEIQRKKMWAPPYKPKDGSAYYSRKVDRPHHNM